MINGICDDMKFVCYDRPVHRGVRWVRKNRPHEIKVHFFTNYNFILPIQCPLMSLLFIISTSFVTCVSPENSS